jgi:hypothetical protein
VETATTRVLMLDAVAATDKRQINEPKVRAYVAALGVNDPTPGQYDDAASRLQEDPADFVRSGADIISAGRSCGEEKGCDHG